MYSFLSNHSSEWQNKRETSKMPHEFTRRYYWLRTIESSFPCSGTKLTQLFGYLHVPSTNGTETNFKSKYKMPVDFCDSTIGSENGRYKKQRMCCRLEYEEIEKNKIKTQFCFTE